MWDLVKVFIKNMVCGNQDYKELVHLKHQIQAYLVKVEDNLVLN